MELERDPLRLQAALLREASQAVEHHGADVTCSAAPACSAAQRNCSARSLRPAAAIPLVAPLPAAAALAIATVRQGVRRRQVS